jgi:hypothetical protein
MAWNISFIHGSYQGSELCSLAWIIMKINLLIDACNLKNGELEEKVGESSERRYVLNGEV